MYHSCSIKEHRQSVTEIIWLFQLLKHWALKGNVFFWIGFPLVSHPVWVLMAIRSFLTSIIDLRQADAIPKTRKMELSVHFQGVQRIDRSRVNGDWVGGWGQMVYYWGKAGRFQAKNTWVGIVLPDTLEGKPKTGGDWGSAFHLESSRLFLTWSSKSMCLMIECEQNIFIFNKPCVLKICNFFGLKHVALFCADKSRSG